MDRNVKVHLWGQKQHCLWLRKVQCVWLEVGHRGLEVGLSLAVEKIHMQRSPRAQRNLQREGRSPKLLFSVKSKGVFHLYFWRGFNFLSALFKCNCWAQTHSLRGTTWPLWVQQQDFLPGSSDWGYRTRAPDSPRKSPRHHLQLCLSWFHECRSSSMQTHPLLTHSRCLLQGAAVMNHSY